jgi:hypothetical protein
MPMASRKMDVSVISLPNSTATGQTQPGLLQRSYPVQWKLSYRRVDKDGESWAHSVTRSIGSRVIAFATRHRYEPGDLLELLIEWPIPQGDETPIELVVLGHVSECSHGHATVSVQRYEFRRRPAAKAAP